MILNNVVARKDMRTGMRSWRGGVMLSLQLSVLGTAALVTMIAQTSGNTYDPVEAGTRLFQALALTQLALVLIIAPLTFTASISLERRRETWDLLLLTRLSAFDIVWGKLVATVAFNLLLAVVGLPFLALVFLFENVGLGQFVQVYAVLLATMLLCGGIGLLSSALVPSTARALIAVGATVATLAVGLSALVLAGAPAIAVGPYQIAPQWSRLAPLDPVAALLSALPDGRSVASLGPLAEPQQPFGLSLTLWVAYVLLAVALSAGLLAFCTRRIGMAHRRPLASVHRSTR